MIKIPLPKILFLDIETVGLCKDYDTCVVDYPKIAEQFDKYFDWFLKKNTRSKSTFPPKCHITLMLNLRPSHLDLKILHITGNSDTIIYRMHTCRYYNACRCYLILIL